MADATLEFLAAARAFRAALESESVAQREFARRVRNALARVFLAAALLGVPRPPMTVDVTELMGDRRDGRALRRELARVLGDGDLYLDVFDPTGLTDDDRKPIEHSLSDDLTDIDTDLADAIAWLEQEVPDALWQIRLDFESHWGKHAVDALRPLHQLAVYGVI